MQNHVVRVSNVMAVRNVVVSGLNWAYKIFTALAVPPSLLEKQRLMHLISLAGFMDEQPVLILQLYSVGKGGMCACSWEGLVRVLVLVM